jgi:hypothetical protein
MLRLATSQSTPIRLDYMSRISSSPFQQQYNFGANPFQRKGLHGCGCDPRGGCGCMPGFHGFFDQIGQSVADWFRGFSQSTLPAQQQTSPYPFGIPGQWIPYIIGGFLVYKLLK